MVALLNHLEKKDEIEDMMCKEDMLVRIEAARGRLLAKAFPRMERQAHEETTSCSDDLWGT